jgi:hypothetical protein
MAAATHSACVRVLAHSHAVIAAISRVRSRRTTADPVRAFIGDAFRYYFWHDLIIFHMKYEISVFYRPQKQFRQASTHPDKGQCLPRSSLSPGKNT